MGDWSSGICECFDPPSSCWGWCIVCLLPPCFFGPNSRNLKKYDPDCPTVCIETPTCAGLCAGFLYGLFFYSSFILGFAFAKEYHLLACPAVLLHANVRYHARKEYSIHRDPCDGICEDFCCALCCYSCAIIQESKRLDTPSEKRKTLMLLGPEQHSQNSMMEYAPEVVNVRINCP
jgi:Cys-rich protein (TIGR01571 family)